MVAVTRGDRTPKFFTITEVAERARMSPPARSAGGSRPAISSCTESAVSSGSLRAIYGRFWPLHREG